MIQVKDKSFTVSKNKNRKSINITWPTLRKSQLKTLEDTAINSLSKLRYKGLTIEGLTDNHQDLCRLIVFLR